MIASRERSTPKEAGCRFAEWASLFPRGLFVHVAVYADDSGTHDETGKLVGSKEATISGSKFRDFSQCQFCFSLSFVFNIMPEVYTNWLDIYCPTLLYCESTTYT
jgi:hypothetical protein